MSKWVKESDISAQLGYKILIAGLSEAGKTAVKRIFFLKQQTKDVDNLSATINYERLSLKVNDLPITIVDLGGQKIFLKRFLSGFSPFFFSNVKIFIFLIDVANKTSRNSAVQYFKACSERLKTFSPEAKYFVFLHKNDLIRNRPNYESIHEQLKEQFQIESPVRLRFFRTTIFKPESVIDSFGRIFEITIPELTQSDFVKGRTIGEIEEYHQISMTLADSKVETDIKTKLRPTPGEKMTHSPELEKLKFIMKHSLKSSDTTLNESNVYLGSAASEESASEAKLIRSAPTPVTNEFETPSQDIVNIPANSEPEETFLESDQSSILERTIHLSQFFGITSEDATELIKNQWDHLFSRVVTSGLPVPLVRDIFLKYLPFIKESKGEGKYRVFDQKKLLELFSVLLKGDLKEEDIEKLLNMIVENPLVSIEELILKYLQPEEKIISTPRSESKDKISEYTHLDIPVEVESAEGVIALPNTQGMGFKIDLVENGLNASISFQLGSTMGQKELIGHSLISTEATEEEILYLLAYEHNFMGTGMFEDGISSMYFAAKIIHESIRKLKADKLRSTEEVTTRKTRSEQGIRINMIDFIIPMEIEVDGNYLLLPDSEAVAFNVELARKGLILSFCQRGFPIGQAHISETITEHQLVRLMREAMQIPMGSKGVTQFVSRIIHATIKKAQEPTETPVKVKEVKPKDIKPQTSDELRKYLELLMNEDQDLL